MIFPGMSSLCPKILCRHPLCSLFRQKHQLFSAPFSSYRETCLLSFFRKSLIIIEKNRIFTQKIRKIREKRPHFGERTHHRRPCPYLPGKDRRQSGGLHRELLRPAHAGQRPRHGGIPAGKREGDRRGPVLGLLHRHPAGTGQSHQRLHQGAEPPSPGIRPLRHYAPGPGRSGGGNGADLKPGLLRHQAPPGFPEIQH